MKHTECEDCELRNGDCGYHFEMEGVTNYDIASLSACDQYGNCCFFKPKVKPKGDLVSRSALERAACVKFYTSPYYKHILDLIDNAPTVKPKKGKWIDTELGWECSWCGYEQTFTKIESRYCLHCGAKMEVGDEE